ncbi:MAG: phosphodiester glycosidase family protein [Planctomycetota bacterium]
MKTMGIWAITASLAAGICSETLTAEDGIQVRSVVRQTPRPLVLSIAEIDLTTVGLAFVVTGENGDPNGDAPGDPNRETTRRTTLQFLRDQRARLAINATFFEMGETDTDNVGLVVSDGVPVSPFYENWPALNIDAQNRAHIVRGRHETFDLVAPEGVQLHNAVSGNRQIVTDGKVTVNEANTDVHPRTAVGIGEDDRLVFLVVDGRQPGVSEGMTMKELGEEMCALGCVQALNLDGGGSSTMAVADPEPRVVNVPSSRTKWGKPGVLRKNGTNLGVRVGRE